ncbi:hypothetical protein V6Z11_A09G095400 [Gossypium hirsutum]
MHDMKNQRGKKKKRKDIRGLTGKIRVLDWPPYICCEGVAADYIEMLKVKSFLGFFTDLGFPSISRNLNISTGSWAGQGPIF